MENPYWTETQKKTIDKFLAQLEGKRVVDWKLSSDVRKALGLAPNPLVSEDQLKYFDLIVSGRRLWEAPYWLKTITTSTFKKQHPTLYRILNFLRLYGDSLFCI